MKDERTEFVEKTIEEKMDDIRAKMIFEKIKTSGLDSIISEVKDYRKIKERSEAATRRLSKKVDEILKTKHTRSVYTTKRK